MTLESLRSFFAQRFLPVFGIPVFSGKEVNIANFLCGLRVSGFMDTESSDLGHVVVEQNARPFSSVTTELYPSEHGSGMRIPFYIHGHASVMRTWESYIRDIRTPPSELYSVVQKLFVSILA